MSVVGDEKRKRRGGLGGEEEVHMHVKGANKISDGQPPPD